MEQNNPSIHNRNERQLALQILIKMMQEKQTLNYLFAAHAPLTAFTKNICFGVCRYYFFLDYLITQRIKKKPDLGIWLILIIGLYQIFYLNKAEYAVVNEMVKLLNIQKKPWAKGLVNGVLRGFCRDKETALASFLPTLNHPAWIVTKIEMDWGKSDAILVANDALPPMSLRVNRLKISRESYLHLCAAAGIHAFPLKFSPVGIGLETPCDVTALPHFSEGFISVQDEAAQLAAPLLDLRPGLRILDACAAPGGKTCHILETEPHLKECVSLDSDPKRLQKIHENLERLQLTASVLHGDALDPAAWWDGQHFDRILLDAPCSAMGVIRRHPDIKMLRTQEEINIIAQRQYNLLCSCWPLLAPQGLLVYATCSIFKQENAHIVARFIAEFADCEFLPLSQPWAQDFECGWQLLPGQFNNDGFFYSVLRKK